MEPLKPLQNLGVKRVPVPQRCLQGDWFFHKNPGAETVPHVLFTPLHYEPGYAYPLLVWLHGPGADERQLIRIMPEISLRNYVAIGVRGILSERACPGKEQGKEKGRRKQRPRYDWPQTPEHIAESADRVFRAIEIARAKRHVGRGRIFLAGSRTGGTMALRIAVQEPELFAGVISLGGPLPTGKSFLRHFSELGHLEVLVSVVRECPDYPSSLVCKDLRLLHLAGVGGIMLREYPAGWHLSRPMLRDVDRWIMERITQGASHPQQEPDAGKVY